MKNPDFVGLNFDEEDLLDDTFWCMRQPGFTYELLAKYAPWFTSDDDDNDMDIDGYYASEEWADNVLFAK